MKTFKKPEISNALKSLSDSDIGTIILYMKNNTNLGVDIVRKIAKKSFNAKKASDEVLAKIVKALCAIGCDEYDLVLIESFDAFEFDSDTQMYNAPLKAKYLNTLKKQEMFNARKAFRAVAESERARGEDFCEFSEADVRNALSDIPVKGLYDLLPSITYLRKYSNWAVDVGECDRIKPNMVEITKNNIDIVIDKEALKLKYISDKNELFKLVKEMEPRRVAAEYVLLFEGLLPEEIISLKKTDIDFVNHTVTVSRNNQRIVIRDMFKDTFEVLRSAIDESFFIANNLVYEYEETDLLLRTVASKGGGKLGENLVRMDLFKMTSFVKEFYGDNRTISIMTLRTSGMFYKLKQMGFDENPSNEVMIEMLKRYGIFTIASNKVKTYRIKFEEYCNIY